MTLQSNEYWNTATALNSDDAGVRQGAIARMIQLARDPHSKTGVQARNLLLVRFGAIVRPDTEIVTEPQPPVACDAPAAAEVLTLPRLTPCRV